MEIRSSLATIVRPREGAGAFVMDNGIREISTHVVEVRELNARKGFDAVHWVHYTKASVASFDDCWRVIEHDERRRMKEECHKGLKTGVQIEGGQYETASRLSAVIGVICVQAVRLLQLRDVARQAPETPARKLLATEWGELVGKLTYRPRTLNTVGEFMRALAELGGFLGRKSDRQTNCQTLSRGRETLILVVCGHHAALTKCR